MSDRVTDERTPIAVMISGQGSNLAAIISATELPDYPATIVRVISDRRDAPGLQYALDAGINCTIVTPENTKGTDDFIEQMNSAMLSCGAQLFCMAGYMRILPDLLVLRWTNRILNVHPSLLPSYRGLHTHRRALKDGVKIHGTTVHVVVPQVDSGPILAQAAVPVAPNDTEHTLRRRIQEAEHKLYPAAIADYVQRLDRSALSDPLYNPPLAD